MTSLVDGLAGRMILWTHGALALEARRSVIEADYQPSDGGIGLLSLRLEDQDTGDSVETVIRLDPCGGAHYDVIEFKTGTCLVLFGAQAVVALDIASLALRSSFGFGLDEARLVGTPWYVEVDARSLLVLATERRVWCLSERGEIRWVWDCTREHEHPWITGPLVVEGDRVRVCIRTVNRDLAVQIRLDDGLPANPTDAR